jgi:uncharacterized protein (TIGR03083 family)
MSEPVVALLDGVWRDLSTLGATLSEADWSTPSELPGWTVKDIYSHLIGTERMLAGDERPDAPPDPGGHVRNQIGQWNEAWVAARRGRTGADVLAEWDQVADRRRAQLAGMTAEDFDRVGFTPEGEGPYRQFLEIRVFDCWLHEHDIRRTLGRPAPRDTAAGRHTLARMIKPMAHVVGRKAAAPAGSSVVITVTGDVALTIPVVVAERAAIAAEPPPAPTATIDVGTAAFVALATGRWDLARAEQAGAIRLGGDLALARRVAENLAYTI